MRTHFLFLFLLFLNGCCGFSKPKCSLDDNSARFRILDRVTGNDLVFGPFKRYDKNSIRFYTVKGTDTITNPFNTVQYNAPGNDSILVVSFIQEDEQRVFVRLSNADTDTLSISWHVVDASPCCEDYTIIKPLSFNGQALESVPEGVRILRK